MGLHIATVTVDCADPAGLARWWAAVLGWGVTLEEPDEVVIEPPDGSSETGDVPAVLFIKVPDKKVVKNRLHFDLRPEDQAVEVARVEALGGRRTDIGQGADVTWVVMADPEGNEFCILRALREDEKAGG